MYIYWYVCVTTNNGAKSKGKNLPFWIKKATAEKKVLFDDDDSDDDDAPKSLFAQARQDMRDVGEEPVLNYPPSRVRHP